MDQFEALKHWNLHGKKFSGVSGTSNENSVAIWVVHCDFWGGWRLNGLLDILRFFFFVIFAFSLVYAINSRNQLFLCRLVVTFLLVGRYLSQSVVYLRSKVIFIISRFFLSYVIFRFVLTYFT